MNNPLDKPITSILGAMSQYTAQQTPSAVDGAELVTTSIGTQQAAIGILGLNAETLASPSVGILKPGSAPLFNSLLQQNGGVVTDEMNSLFTGKNGASSLDAFISNQKLQCTTATAALDQSTAQLAASGVISGNEAPGVIAPLAMSGVMNGVPNTVNAIQNVVGSSLTVGVPGINKSLALGATAVANSLGLIAGLGSVTGTFNAIAKITNLGAASNASKGAAAAAFLAIAASFKPFKTGIPQNLYTLAVQASAAANSVASGTATPLTLAKSALAIASTVTNAKPGGQLSAISTVIGAAMNFGQANSVISQVGALSALAGASATAFGASSKNAAAIAGVINSGSLLALANGAQPQVNALNGLITAIAPVTGISPSKLNAINGTLLSALSIGSSNSIGGVVSGSSRLLNTLATTSPGAASFVKSLNIIPGGLDTVSNVLQSAYGKTPLPGGPLLGPLANNASTAALNGISTQQSLTGELGATGTSIPSLPSISSITSLTTLPGIANALKSLNIPGKLKVAKTATNTSNNADQQAQAKALLGPDNLPPLTSHATDLSGQEQAIQDLIAKQAKADQIQLLSDKVADAQSSYNELVTLLPQGSQELIDAKNNLDDLQAQLLQFVTVS